MGTHNRITREKYKQIKADCKTPKDYQRVMRKYHISKTTVRCIRNSGNYDFYRLWVAGKIHKNLVDVEPPRIHVKPVVHETTPPRFQCFNVSPKPEKVGATGREVAVVAFLAISAILDVILIILLLGKLAE